VQQPLLLPLLLVLQVLLALLLLLLLGHAQPMFKMACTCAMWRATTARGVAAHLWRCCGRMAAAADTCW
jgi:hypothetical protein